MRSATAFSSMSKEDMPKDVDGRKVGVEGGRGGRKAEAVAASIRMEKSFIAPHQRNRRTDGQPVCLYRDYFPSIMGLNG